MARNVNHNSGDADASDGEPVRHLRGLGGAQSPGEGDPMTEVPDSGDDALTVGPAIAAFRVDSVQGRAVVVASGEVDVTTAPGLREALGTASQVSARVVLDLTAVTFLDSSGIAVLLETMREGRRGHRTSLCLAGARARVRRVLDITRVDRMLPTYATLAEALERHS